jgi:hypothetical protein
MFPTEYVKTVLLPATNATDIQPKVVYHKFLTWLGCWLLMATTEGCEQRDFWEKVNQLFFVAHRFV